MGPAVLPLSVAELVRKGLMTWQVGQRWAWRARALLSAKIVIAWVTKRRVHFDILILMKDLIIFVKRVYGPSVLRNAEMGLVLNTA